MPASCRTPLEVFDARYQKNLQGMLAGVDEVGRGPLAGPVVAAAVIFRKDVSLSGIQDSKKISAKQREILFPEICKYGLIGIGTVSESIIDRINIYQASRLAMKQAVLSLTHTPQLILVDGPMKLDLPLSQQAIVKGDAQSASIAAASIIAKVYRDALMRQYDEIYPLYGFKQHKGYPTPRHLERLRAVGPSPIHRKSFAPVRAAMANKAKREEHAVSPV